MQNFPYNHRQLRISGGNRISQVMAWGWWGIGAVAGGCLWAIKSLSILIADIQPDYLCELAPIALAAAAFGLALTWYRESRRHRVPVGLGALALVSAVVAGVSYVIRGDDEGLFGPALMIAMIAIIVLLFWVGRPLRQTAASAHWRVIPYRLAWSFAVAVPLSGLLSALDERLLEVPLLAISILWVWLGAAHMVSAFRLDAGAG
jgi:hypothetical protein